jgi:predicted RNA-binding Zn-ribbon protein involved in translation (DUF1610 family)
MNSENSAQSKPVPLDCALGAEQEEKIKCCPQCNYAKTKLEIEQSRYDYPCPNCDTARISDYYTLGSKKHQDILDGAALQMAPRSKWIPPLPMPKKSP